MSDLSGEKTGLKTAVAELHSPDLSVPGSEPIEQLALLPLQEPGKVVPPSLGKPLPAPRGAGRPAGSQNNSTKEWTNFILSRYTSPLIAMAETYSRSVHDLAAELGCSRLEAYKLQHAAKVGLAPYLHKRQPLEVETNGAPLMGLQINMGNFQASQSPINPDVFTIAVAENNGESNQLLSDLENENSVECNSVESQNDE